MPDGVRISPCVQSWQARPLGGCWRRLEIRSNAGSRQSFYARGCPTSARKNPARVVALTGSIRWVPKPVALTGHSVPGLFPLTLPIAGQGHTLAPLEGTSEHPLSHGRASDEHPHYTGRFKHRQRR